MKTSGYVLLLAMALIQIACKKNSGQIQPAQPSNEINQEKYVVVNINYTAVPGGITEESIEQRPALEYVNRTDLQQKVVLDPGDIFERSTFKRESKQEYLIDNQGQLFNVPVEIQNNQVSLGVKKWMYAEQETKLPTQLNFRDSIYALPGKKITVNLSIIYKKIQTFYTAQLKGQLSGKLVDVTGTWTGIYPSRKNFTYTTQPL